MTLNIGLYKKRIEESKRSNEKIFEILTELAQEINDPSLNLKTIFKDDRYPYAFFYCLASEETIKNLVLKNFKESKYPSLVSHLLLIRASLINEESKMLEYIVSFMLNNKEHFNSVGSTIGYAIGYLIGKNIENGNDISVFSKIAKSPYITDRDVFLNGLKDGVSKSNKSLLENKKYLDDFNDRYSEWDNDLKKLSMSNFSIYYENTILLNNKKNGIKALNEKNQKLTWFLKGLKSNNKLIETLSNKHDELLENQEKLLFEDQLNIRWQAKEKELIDNVELSPTYKTAIELNKFAINAKEALENEIKLLKIKKESLTPIEIKSKLKNIL